MSTTEDQIKKLYSSRLASQKEQLQQDYMKADAEYAAEKEKAQKATDANLTRTAVEAQKSAVSAAELHNAYGLSSGARAQARLAQENQLLANLTALRTQQQELDADVERQRSLLSQQYQSAIRQAQAENDLAKAQALYEEARRKQDALTAQQQTQNQYAFEYAKLMADAGEYGPWLEFMKNQGVSVGDNAYDVLMGETAQPPTTVPSATPSPQVTPADYSNAVRQYVASMNGHSVPGITPANSNTSNAHPSMIKSPEQPQTDNLVLDQNSIIALGFGSISAETLNKLIDQGLVEEYVEDGKLKFRKTAKGGGMPHSTALMPNR